MITPDLDLDALVRRVMEHRAKIGSDDPRRYLSGLSVADACALVAEVRRLREAASDDADTVAQQGTQMADLQARVAELEAALNEARMALAASARSDTFAGQANVGVIHRIDRVLAGQPADAEKE